MTHFGAHQEKKKVQILADVKIGKYQGPKTLT